MPPGQVARCAVQGGLATVLIGQLVYAGRVLTCGLLYSNAGMPAAKFGLLFVNPRPFALDVGALAAQAGVGAKVQWQERCQSRQTRQRWKMQRVV